MVIQGEEKKELTETRSAANVVLNNGPKQQGFKSGGKTSRGVSASVRMDWGWQNGLRPSPLQGATVIVKALPYSSWQGQGERKEDFGGIQLRDLCAFKPLSLLHRALDQS